jgi:acetyl-CoA carboxylase biotin carboxyl carrier protein
MKRSELTDFEVEEEGFKLRIRRDGGRTPGVIATPVTYQAAAPTAPSAKPADSSPDASPNGNPVQTASGTPAEETGIIYVKSPMVGTFYRAPSPESPPFVDIGAKVSENSVVCIIEAMKIMNEIQAEVKGAIVEVLVESGQPVEYGQRLFKVKQG